MEQVVVAWSGGKDCALMLDELLVDDGVEVLELFTTINARYDRSTMHGVRRELYEAQADAVGLPINLVELPADPSNEEYERVMAREHERYRDRGVDRLAFADLFLEDVRSYREAQLEGTGISGGWPLWGRDTGEVARAFLDRGFGAVVVAVDASVLGPELVGRPYDAAFIDQLPPDADPCGEHGEFHTFVTEGPPFDRSIAAEVGETVTRPVGEGEFHYADLRIADTE